MLSGKCQTVIRQLFPAVSAGGGTFVSRNQTMHRNMKRFLFLLAALAACTAAAKAQNPTTDISAATAIRGKVLTTERQPIEFANIALLSEDSTFVQGTCSGSDGSFEILRPAEKGNYLLQISSIGYKTLCCSCHTRETALYLLEPDVVMLAETVVTAARPVFRLKSGTLQASIQHTLLASLTDATEVLKHIPGLHSNDEGYTVFGKGTPVIYIDNRRVQDASELARLAASDIDKVELITNPGAEYDATVKAVVRIRTLRGKEDGWGGSIRAGVAQRRRTGHNEQISLNYQKKGLSLQGMVYANYQDSKRRQEVRYLIPSEGTEWDVNNRVNLRNKGWLGGGKATVGYDFSPKHSIGASYEFHRMPDFHLSDLSAYTVLADGKPDDRTDHRARTLQQSSRHQFNAYYQGTVKELQINFTADVVGGKSNDHQEANETSRTEGVRDISSYNRAANRLYAARLVLTHPLGRGTLKAGADYSFIRRKDRFLNLQGILPDTDSRIDESKTAAFAEYSLSWGKVSVLAGLRYEHAVSDYWEQGAFVSGQSRVYNDWRPNFSVDFPIGKAQGSVSYTAKSNRPGFFQLRSTLSYNNRFVYEGGNPLLTPETNHDLQFSTLYRWLQVRLNYQYRRNAIAFMTKEHDENPDAVIFTTANFKRMQYLTASAHLSPSIGLWKPELGVFFVQPFFEVVNQGSTRSMNRSSVYLTLQNSFRLPGEWILSLDADYQSEGNFGAMLQRSYWGVDAGIRKVFFHRKLTVSLQANDLWNSRYGSFMLFGPRMTYTKKANPDSRCFSLNISYRFRAAGKAYRGRHAAEEDLRRL